MGASISQNKFAARIGRSRQRVGQLVAEGKLPVLADKSLPMPEALQAWHALQGEEQGEPAAETSPRSRGGAPGPRSPAEAADHAAAAKLTMDMRRVQLTQRAMQSKLLELQVGQRRGELVPVAEVRAEAVAVAAALRERLFAIPSRVSSLLEAAVAKGGSTRAAVIEALVADEINAALERVQDSRFLAEALPKRAAS